MNETQSVWDIIRDTLFTPQVITSAVFIVVCLIIWLAVRRLYRTYEAKKKEETGSPVVRTPALTAYRAFEYILLVLAVIVVLQINGVNVSSLIAGLGVVGIVVGYSLQDIIKDAIMGAHIQSDHFFQVGDVVKIGEIEGIVIDFNMRTTKILSSLDGSTISLCNRNIEQAAVVSTFNYIDVPLSYEADMKDVYSALQNICAKIEEADGIEKCEFKGTSGFEDSSITYRINFYCRPERRFEMKRFVLGTLEEELPKAGLEIPYSHVDVHVT